MQEKEDLATWKVGASTRASGMRSGQNSKHLLRAGGFGGGGRHSKGLDPSLSKLHKHSLQKTISLGLRVPISRLRNLGSSHKILTSIQCLPVMRLSLEDIFRASGGRVSVDKVP